MSDRKETRYEFGPFTVVMCERALLKAGEPVPLTPKEFETLHVLLREAGRLVSKEEIIKQVWPDTFVSDGSIARNISVLRKALGDSYIRTVPKSGYRFTGAVKVSEESAALPRNGTGPETGAASTTTPGPTAGHRAGGEPGSGTLANTLSWADSERRPKRSVAAGAVVLLVVFSVLGAVLYRSREIARPDTPPLEVTHRQVTFTGSAYDPAISPDGVFVTYVLRTFGKEDRLITQALAGGPVLELLHGRIGPPGWSPTGSTLAFDTIDQTKKPGVFVLPRLGGTPRRVARLGYSCWSPDGSQIMTAATNAEYGIAWTNNATGEEKRIPAPSYQWLHDSDCSSRTGQVLLVSESAGKFQIWIMQPNGTEQRKLVESPTWILSVRWSPAGDSIYYLLDQGDTASLMKISTAARSPASSALVTGLETQLAPDNDTDPFSVSADGAKLAYTRSQSYAHLWLTDVHAQKSVARKPQKPMTSGTSSNVFPKISPDGRWVAFVEVSNGRGEIYKLPVEGGQAIRLTFLDAAIDGTPAWSPDGRKIAFICDKGGVQRIWLVGADGGPARQLERTDATNTNYQLSWAPSREILYQTTGLHNFRRLNAETQEEKPVLKKDSTGWLPFRPIPSPDAKQIAANWNRADRPGVWLIRLDDGSSTFLFGGNYLPFEWSRDGRFVYAVGYREHDIIEIGVGSSKPPRRVIDLPGFCYGATVTPDGRKIIASIEEKKSDVWLMENFDPLARQTNREKAE